MGASPPIPDAEAERVLRFWFDEVPAELRFARDAGLDARIAREFGALHALLAQGVPPGWQDHPRRLLAAVIVLDQFSRNLYRDDGRAFAQDEAALALTRRALASGFDEDMTSVEQQFLYMPFMHSERLPEVERSIALMEQSGNADAAAFARRHAEAIARFGRYPARNEALGRASTAEEVAYLAEHPQGF